MVLQEEKCNGSDSVPSSVGSCAMTRDPGVMVIQRMIPSMCLLSQGSWTASWYIWNRKPASSHGHDQSFPTAGVCSVDESLGGALWMERPSRTGVAMFTVCYNLLHLTLFPQGCMICLGQSTFLRFNHPAEAKWMKSMIPAGERSPGAPYGLMAGR